MKIKILLLIFLYSSLNYACKNTTQFKTFPIGTNDKQIITFEAFIYRGDYFNKDSKDQFIMPKTSWTIKSFISVYSYNGTLISKQEFESTEIKNDKYLSELQKLYKKGIDFTTDKYPKITLFKPSYISFCGYQKQCEILKLQNDTINKKDYLIYKKKKHAINLDRFSDSKKSMLFSNSLSSYFISSTRIYKTDTIEIVIGHLETGHEISMGWMTTDKKRKNEDEDDYFIYTEEKKPDFEFTDIKKAVYEEPLLHHAYGFDFLIVAKK